jgi:hypothetical protein
MQILRLGGISERLSECAFLGQLPEFSLRRMVMCFCMWYAFTSVVGIFECSKMYYADAKRVSVISGKHNSCVPDSIDTERATPKRSSAYNIKMKWGVRLFYLAHDTVELRTLGNTVVQFEIQQRFFISWASPNLLRRSLFHGIIQLKLCDSDRPAYFWEHNPRCRAALCLVFKYLFLLMSRSLFYLTTVDCQFMWASS